jgi:predicted dehydrogenase
MSSPSAPPLRIGVLGAAAIAPAALIKPARAVDRVDVTAVAARDPERARKFAAKHGIARIHTSYDDLVADDEIDAVYNPLPNSLHAPWTIKALEAGKHVLCEKPLTSNAIEAEAVAAIADRTGRVLMEAFHYRYHPLMARAVELVQGGTLGELQHVYACMQIPLLKPGDIRYNTSLAGGAVMDLGCYSIHQLRSLAGEEPDVTRATAKQRPPGIDLWMQADLAFPGGASGRFTVSLYGAVPLRIGLWVQGSDGELRILNPTMPQLYSRFVVRDRKGKRTERFPRTPTYQYQLEAFAAAVLDGQPTLTPPSDSIANMRVIDAVYEAAGMQPRASVLP